MKLSDRFIVLAVTLVVAAAPLRAQELAAYATGATPGTYRDQTFGAGASAAAFFRLGSIFVDDLALSRSQLRIGFRIGYSEYRASQHRDNRCTFFGGCTYDPHTVRSRMGATNWQLLLAPYWSSATRVELGGGMAHYAFRGDEAPNRNGLTASVAMSRRLVPERRWWATVGYTLHGSAVGALLMDDANNFSPPDHSFQAGIAYRLR